MFESRFGPSTLKPDNLHLELLKLDKVRPWTRFWPVLVLTFASFDRVLTQIHVLSLNLFILFRYAYHFQVQVFFLNPRTFYRSSWIWKSKRIWKQCTNMKKVRRFEKNTRTRKKYANLENYVNLKKYVDLKIVRISKRYVNLKFYVNVKKYRDLEKVHAF